MATLWTMVGVGAALSVAAVYAWRTHRDEVAGIAAAGATLAAGAPIALLLLFVARRGWRAVGWATATLALGVALLGSEPPGLQVLLAGARLEGAPEPGAGTAAREMHLWRLVVYSFATFAIGGLFASADEPRRSRRALLEVAGAIAVALCLPLGLPILAQVPFALALLPLAFLIARERRAERAAAEAPAPVDLEISVFFPAYNEGQNIGGVVERALSALARCARRYEVIVVDDCSKDDTPAVVAALEAKHPDVVRHVRHEANRGYGGAVKTGLASARFDWVFFSDGDGQFDLSELPDFVRPLAGGRSGAVIGYRKSRQDPAFRLLNAYCWGALVRTLFGIAARDIDCAFKILPTRIVQRLELKSEGALISTELLAKLGRAGVVWAELPVTHLPRERGAPTGANPKVILRAFLELFRFRKELAGFRLGPVQPAAAAPREAALRP